MDQAFHTWRILHLIHLLLINYFRFDQRFPNIQQDPNPHERSKKVVVILLIILYKLSYIITNALPHCLRHETNWQSMHLHPKWDREKRNLAWTFTWFDNSSDQQMLVKTPRTILQYTLDIHMVIKLEKEESRL